MMMASSPGTVLEPHWWLNASVIAAGITGSVTAAGWLVNKILDTRAQAQMKKTEFRKAYIQKQIEDFYGPLYSLLWQIFTINHLQSRILQHKALAEQDRSKVTEYFALAHFASSSARQVDT